LNQFITAEVRKMLELFVKEVKVRIAVWAVILLGFVFGAAALLEALAQF